MHGRNAAQLLLKSAQFNSFAIILILLKRQKTKGDKNPPYNLRLTRSTLQATPMKSKHFQLVLLLPLIISIALWFSFNKTVSSAPDVTLNTITGKQIVLKELRGKPVIITFWATDCPACIKEIPHLIDLYTHYHQQGLEIIAVAMSYDPPNHVITLTEDLQLPYNVALDLNGEIAHAFGNVQLTPSTFLISPQGLIVLQKTGAFDPEKMKNLIETLIKG
jgi:peroxiredoxin